MASKNKHSANRPKRKPESMRNAPGPMRNLKKPLLYLIGFGGLAVGAAALWPSPSEPAVDVERTRYASRDACLQDWNDPSDCEFAADAGDAAMADAASGASGASYGGSSGAGHGGGGSTGEGGWYGPYYARDGFVYHASGLRTIGVPMQHGTVSSLTVRESALSAGSSSFRSTPRSVSESESRAISRGGFMSFRGGSGGEGGGHGGEGGHGGGGGHGSGGG